MEKTVHIGDKDIKMRVSARVPFDYRYCFGKDIIAEMQKIEKSGEVENFEVFENLAWLLAKNAGEEVYADLPVKEAVATWLDGFDDMFAIIQATPDIMELWLSGSNTLSKPRKK